MKYSPYQRKIIEVLQAGELLYYISGLHAHYWIGKVKPRPSHSTVEALWNAGLLVVVKNDWRGTAWKWNEEAQL